VINWIRKYKCFWRLLNRHQRTNKISFIRFRPILRRYFPQYAKCHQSLILSNISDTTSHLQRRTKLQTSSNHRRIVLKICSERRTLSRRDTTSNSSAHWSRFCSTMIKSKMSIIKYWTKSHSKGDVTYKIMRSSSFQLKMEKKTQDWKPNSNKPKI